MALIRDDFCGQCRHTTQHVNGRCSNCSQRETRQQAAAWEALTVEEKLRDLQRRIERLEQGPPTY